MASSVDLTPTIACHCLAARRSARVITRFYDERLRPHGLRATQFSILAALALKGVTSLGDLAEFLGLERTTLSRSAALLEQKGWLAQAQSDDARERRLRLTEDGRHALAGAFPAWRQAQDQVGRQLAGDIDLGP